MSWHDASGNGNDSVYHADITTARFSEASTWTYLAHFRVASHTTQRTVICKSKYNSSLQIYFCIWTDGKFTVTTSANFATIYTGTASDDTWYVVALSCDGSQTTGDLHLSVFTMDGAVEVDDVTGTHGTDQADIAHEIWHGTFIDSNWEWDGDICHSCYVNTDLSQSQAKGFVREPAKMAQIWQEQYGIEWYLPMFGPAIDDTGVDWSDSGNGNWSQTASGSQTVGDNSPTGALFENASAVPAIATGGGTALVQSAVATIEMDSFAGTVSADHAISQTAVETIEIVALSGSVKADQDVAQTAVATIETVTFAGSVKADQDVAQTAIETVEIASFAGSVTSGGGGGGTALSQTAVATIELVGIDGTASADHAISQSAVATIELASFAGTLSYGSLSALCARTFVVPISLVSMTTTQRDATSPDGPWIIFNSTTGTFQGWNGSSWDTLTT